MLPMRPERVSLTEGSKVNPYFVAMVRVSVLTAEKDAVLCPRRRTVKFAKTLSGAATPSAPCMSTAGSSESEVKARLPSGVKSNLPMAMVGTTALWATREFLTLKDIAYGVWPSSVSFRRTYRAPGSFFHTAESIGVLWRTIAANSFESSDSVFTRPWMATTSMLRRDVALVVRSELTEKVTDKVLMSPDNCWVSTVRETRTHTHACTHAADAHIHASTQTHTSTDTHTWQGAALGNVAEVKVNDP